MVSNIVLQKITISTPYWMCPITSNIPDMCDSAAFNGGILTIDVRTTLSGGRILLWYLGKDPGAGLRRIHAPDYIIPAVEAWLQHYHNSIPWSKYITSMFDQSSTNAK